MNSPEKEGKGSKELSLFLPPEPATEQAPPRSDSLASAQPFAFSPYLLTLLLNQLILHFICEDALLGPGTPVLKEPPAERDNDHTV